MAEKTLMEAMTELEKAVSYAKSKENVVNELHQKYQFASKEYGDAVAKVNELRASLNDRLGNIFPDQQNSRVKVS